MTDPQTDCRLLGLPPELRNRIYEYTFYMGDVHLVKRTNETDVATPHQCLEFLRTCRQIHNEARGFFYTENALIIDGSDLEEFIKTLSADRLNYITTITVEKSFCFDMLSEDLCHLKLMKHLRNVILNIAVRTAGGFAHYTFKRYERPVLYATFKRMKHLEKVTLIRTGQNVDLSELKKLEGDIQKLLDKCRAKRRLKAQ